MSRPTDATDDRTEQVRAGSRRLRAFARKLWPPRVPWRVRATASVCYGLAVRYGHYRTAASGRCHDASGKPIPWYTYPAIEYLAQVDLSDARVFEYGAGNSTLWWADRAASVDSVEGDAAWYAEISAMKPANTEIRLIQSRDDYARAITQAKGPFDVVVIDGEYRRECAEVVIANRDALLSPGALVILDNGDWYPTTARRLRDAGFLEVDMHGFAPVAEYSSTTSLFFSRDFNRGPRSGRQPSYSAAARRGVWDGEEED